METISARLAKKVGQAPSFFHNAPVVLNLGKIPDPDLIDLSRLLALVREQGLIPVGITNCTENQQSQAEAMKLAVLTTRGSGRLQEKKAEEKQEEEVAPEENTAQTEPAAHTSPAATVITEPIRSGQRVVVEQGDLIVLTSVGSGAEVMAAGNIHVYGALRGRAFAGNTGDTKARIFCQQLEAELIAVAGVYLVNENFPDNLRAQPVHIRLQTEKIRITPL
ncbi:putative septum site-determining protein MinC [Candidatus Electrothrix laxa]